MELISQYVLQFWRTKINVGTKWGCYLDASYISLTLFDINKFSFSFKISRSKYRCNFVIQVCLRWVVSQFILNSFCGSWLDESTPIFAI